jgi:hypothetical protein
MSVINSLLGLHIAPSRGIKILPSLHSRAAVSLFTVDVEGRVCRRFN